VTRETIIKIANCNSGGWGRPEGGQISVKTKGHPVKRLTEMIPRDVLGRKIHLETEKRK
jgi:hypothetical protein